MPGERVTLTCRVDSNPQPSYIWYRTDAPNHIISHSGNLTFVVGEGTRGQYVCRASVRGYPDVSEAAMVFMKGPPIMVNKLSRSNSASAVAMSVLKGSVSKAPAVRVQHAVEGAKVGRVICEAFSVPEPDLIEWTRNGRILDEGDPKYEFPPLQAKDGLVSSTLIVKNVDKADFGAYKCTVANSFGSDAAELLLKKKSKRK